MANYIVWRFYIVSSLYSGFEIGLRPCLSTRFTTDGLAAICPTSGPTKSGLGHDNQNHRYHHANFHPHSSCIFKSSEAKFQSNFSNGYWYCKHISNIILCPHIQHPHLDFFDRIINVMILDINVLCCLVTNQFFQTHTTYVITSKIIGFNIIPSLPTKP